MHVCHLQPSQPLLEAIPENIQDRYPSAEFMEVRITVCDSLVCSEGFEVCLQEAGCLLAWKLYRGAPFSMLCLAVEAWTMVLLRKMIILDERGWCTCWPAWSCA